MIMATDKRKSTGGGPSRPPKFLKSVNQQGNSPGAGGRGKKAANNSFGGGQQKSPGGGGKPQDKKLASPKKEGQQTQKKNTPPPPPVGAKKMEVTTATEERPQAQKKNQLKKEKSPAKSPLAKVSSHSKNIQKKKTKKSRYQRFTDKLDAKAKPAGACERALKAEQELGHGGRVYLVKIADPPITESIVKSWNPTIEAAVFSKPVEPRQFLVIFKHDTNVKKEVEALKKVSFAGAKITIEEKLDNDTRLVNNPDNIDPFCLYVTNLQPDVSREKVQKLFTGCSTVTTPKKHNPRIGTSTKFCFVAFDSADDALAALKSNYNTTLAGNTLVMRFRRVSHSERNALEVAAKTKAATAKKDGKLGQKQPVKAEAGKKKGELPKKAPVAAVKDEPESDEEDEDEDEEEENETAAVENEEGEDETDDDDDDDDMDEDDEDDDDDLEDDDDDDDEDDDDDDEDDD